MFKGNLKKFNSTDLGLVKLSSISFILFLITVWPAAMDLVHRIHWGWFLGAAVLFALRPTKKFYSK